MLLSEASRHRITEVPHQDAEDIRRDEWTGTTRRGMAETIPDRRHLNLQDVENAPPPPDLLHVRHLDVVLRPLEVHHADAEEVQVIVLTAATVEAGALQEVAVQAEHATVAGDSVRSSRWTSLSSCINHELMKITASRGNDTLL